MNTNEPESFTLNDTEQKIAVFCAEKPRTVRDLAALLDIKHGSGEMMRSTNRLLQLKLIEFTIPGYNRSYAQRYRTTPKGKEYLRNHLPQP